MPKYCASSRKGSSFLQKTTLLALAGLVLGSATAHAMYTDGNGNPPYRPRSSAARSAAQKKVVEVDMVQWYRKRKRLHPALYQNLTEATHIRYRFTGFKPKGRAFWYLHRVFPTCKNCTHMTVIDYDTTNIQVPYQNAKVLGVAIGEKAPNVTSIVFEHHKGDPITFHDARFFRKPGSRVTEFIINNQDRKDLLACPAPTAGHASGGGPALQLAGEFEFNAVRFAKAKCSLQGQDQKYRTAKTLTFNLEGLYIFKDLEKNFSRALKDYANATHIKIKGNFESKNIYETVKILNFIRETCGKPPKIVEISGSMADQIKLDYPKRPSKYMWVGDLQAEVFPEAEKIIINGQEISCLSHPLSEGLSRDGLHKRDDATQALKASSFFSQAEEEIPSGYKSAEEEGAWGGKASRATSGPSSLPQCSDSSSSDDESDSADEPGKEDDNEGWWSCSSSKETAPCAHAAFSIFGSLPEDELNLQDDNNGREELLSPTSRPTASQGYAAFSAFEPMLEDELNLQDDTQAEEGKEKSTGLWFDHKPSLWFEQ